MINKQDKIDIIKQTIDQIEDRQIATVSYIDKINSGMEDPDRDLVACQAVLLDLIVKKESLFKELDLLTKTE